MDEEDECGDLDFVCCDRPIREREYRARGYLRNRSLHGYVSRSGNGGRATLIVVATHLRVFLGLSIDFCFMLLTRPVNRGGVSWNALCCWDEDGTPYPWSDVELRSALEAAEGFVPGFGVREYRRLEAAREVDRCLNDFVSRLQRHSSGSWFYQRVSASELYWTFMREYDLPIDRLHLIVFGRKFVEACKAAGLCLERRKVGRRKYMVYHGFGLKHGLARLCA